MNTVWFLFISGTRGPLELIFNVDGGQYKITRIHVGCVPGVLNMHPIHTFGIGLE